MKRACLLLGLLSLCIACSDDGEQTPPTGGAGGGSNQTVTTSGGGEASDGGGGSAGLGGSEEGGAGGEGGSGGKPTVCAPYPSELVLPDTQAAAAADLDTFAPDATLSWSTTRQTLSLLTGLNVSLDCAGGDVWGAAWAFFAEHPDLFQVDPLEWIDMPPYPCSAVTGPTVTSTYREELAGLGVQKDVLGLFVSPGGSGLVLTGVSGFYLPVLSPGSILDCDDLPPDVLEENVRATSMPYSTFDFCAPTGSGTYEPDAEDAFDLAESTWEWDDGTGVVIARKVQVAYLTIAEENVTPELMASDANCPDETGDERVYGFTIRLDPITGEILDIKPGIGCIVC